MHVTEFRALVSAPQDGRDRREMRTLTLDDLPAGELLVRVGWSGVNYKDALAASATGGVAEIDVLVPGIDLAGEVVESADAAFAPGDAIVVHGYGLGTARHGGYAEYARVPSAWALPVPAGLTPRDAMVLGTAGWTAAASIDALQHHGLRAGGGPVLVTGATGGVGMCAVAMLARLGCEVTACTGKTAEHARLLELGAAEVIGREEIAPSGKPLARQRWAGVVDCVGGDVLAGLLPAVRYGGAVAASGMAGGFAVKTTVLPFILRGVGLLGINSVDTPMGPRRAVWDRMAGDLRPADLGALAHEIALEEVPATMDALLASEHVGRAVVAVG
ncbi:acryloyl-CoA reductase [Baekduia soli]|uniref:Acryloyl-CoA reductase n=1 Tax=Baekduia soli TaxID=496014 RepID=A0A5B8U5Y7_9ACTN|nr:acryloyl-CoA reductase [Baekduia soli]QEC48351.1 acryloyl-CoA reductase [Baekduia soli]